MSMTNENLIITDKRNYEDIADAIREKGVNGTFKPSEMGNAIRSIQGEGTSGVTSVNGRVGAVVLYSEDILTPQQMNAVNSGVTSSKIQEIGNLRNDVTELENKNGSTISAGDSFGSRTIESVLVENEADIDIIESEIPQNTSMSNKLVNKLELDTKVGNLNNLNTTYKYDVVGAVNEVLSKVYGVNELIESMDVLLSSVLGIPDNSLTIELSDALYGSDI